MELRKSDEIESPALFVYWHNRRFGLSRQEADSLSFLCVIRKQSVGAGHVKSKCSIVSPKFPLCASILVLCIPNINY